MTHFSMHKKIHVFLVGPGLVGGTLLQQINEHSQNVKVCGIINSHQAIFDPVGINLNQWKDELVKGQSIDLSQLVSKIKNFELKNSVLVDCTSSEKVVGIYKEALENKIAVVTPNKKAASGKLSEYRELQQLSQETPYLYEVNVGAGLPVISTLKDLIATGDKVIKIEAILSGTLSYIFNTYDGNTPFSQVVKNAQEKGYTEPDPRDDLNGMDVARKILILAREAGVKLELSDVEVENLSPEPAQNASSVDEFFEKLSDYDHHFEGLIQKAKAEHKVLRYIASFENGKALVQLKPVNQNHPFYNMSGSDNIISYATKRYNETPIVIKGPGAGAEVTAAGVFADILKSGNRK